MTSFTLDTFSASTRALNLDETGTVTASGSLVTDATSVTIFAGGTRLVNAGLIASQSGSAVSVQAGSAAIVNTGDMIAGSDVIRFAGTNGILQQVTNTGTLSAQGATGAGISAMSGGLFLNNAGSILSALGDAVQLSSGATATVNRIVNSGTLSTASILFSKAINLASDIDLVTNTGSIIGGIDLGDGDNQIVNRGLIEGNLIALGGNDRIDLRGGTLWGTVSSGAGRDTVLGSAGEDVITGGGGADSLSGKAGADAFVYKAIGDSGLAANARDVIADFRHRVDVIDLSAIDAQSGIAGDQAFQLVTGGFSAAGQMRVVQKEGARWVELNLDADKAAEGRIVLMGNGAISAGDFVF